MAAITNYDLFEDLFNFIKKADCTIADVIKEHGGSSLYIPSYKTTLRNEEIIKEYKKRHGERRLAKKLAKDYDLSEAQILLITKPLREPSLFN
jgi:Mor family transcriptional regulator